MRGKSSGPGRLHGQGRRGGAETTLELYVWPGGLAGEGEPGTGP